MKAVEAVEQIGGSDAWGALGHFAKNEFNASLAFLAYSSWFPCADRSGQLMVQAKNTKRCGGHRLRRGRGSEPV
jgi:hypothetical protein